MRRSTSRATPLADTSHSEPRAPTAMLLARARTQARACGHAARMHATKCTAKSCRASRNCEDHSDSARLRARLLLLVAACARHRSSLRAKRRGLNARARHTRLATGGRCLGCLCMHCSATVHASAAFGSGPRRACSEPSVTTDAQSFSFLTTSERVPLLPS